MLMFVRLKYDSVLIHVNISFFITSQKNDKNIVNVVTVMLSCYCCTAQCNYWQAMRYYLELGVVTTDFFSESVTKNVYNEQVDIYSHSI